VARLQHESNCISVGSDWLQNVRTSVLYRHSTTQLTTG